MKKYIYYWYHHNMPLRERNAIYKTIKNKDFEGFIELYKKYSIKAIENGFRIKDEEFDCWIPMIYLPSTISCYNLEDEHDFEVLSVLDRENFEKIDYNECECG